MKAVRSARFQRLLKNRWLLVVLLDQFDHEFAAIGEGEAHPHLGHGAAINAFGRHERADQPNRQSE
jgi:hypothetical protein